MDRVTVENLAQILENMGIKVTEEKMQEALKRVTVDGKNFGILSLRFPWH